MSKRKRVPKSTDDSASKPAADDSGDDASVKDDMVHVTPDLLAGSPDIFAPQGGSSSRAERADEPVAETPEVASEPFPAEPPAEAEGPPTGEAMAAEPADTGATLAPEPDGSAGEPAPEAPAPPPPAYVTAVAHPPRPRRGNSSAALGAVLVVLGVFALGVAITGVNLAEYSWPLFVIIPGLTLLVFGFFSLGASASIPGGIITMLGLLLAYQNSTGDWATWAFAWSLVVPFGLGLGMYLQALRDRDVPALGRGRMLMFVGLLIFMIGFVFFEPILNISNRDYGIAGKAALPVLLIVIGIILLVRSIQRSRRA